MSKIAAAHIGIEQLTAISREEIEVSLPDRYALLPDGQSVETHAARLYPANKADQALLAFACPQDGFHALLRPHDFRQAVSGLRTILQQGNDIRVQHAVSLLENMNQDEQLLQMALHLLHKV
ncbi:YscX family type III secretion system protein SctX [Photorhabdus laumondii subsp. laumondii]|uniref:Type III secretion protein SctX n=3 Tax=Photorhabdus laumondii TaxID=2218628 RepID=Q7N0W6_PHOLL|nr:MULTISPECIES: YscX family type III secretion system protein SctX [Photorhabdus]NHB62186.1 YscX family type III secretion protein [Photorhabdus sp. RW14-46]PQQ38352.1 YscX family type III secretion protein [Photorhabdus luminescens]AWK43382.1 type III secretion protein [Photorhabdus laumondii subsp. laumondii]AXG44055.1 YscX family type III secretion protein [Photorhabdus laumondii subsp. laumondii]AXG48688.1 YscX family type III secretion protein [Photorhabdus laumondii subsp. laumondii]